MKELLELLENNAEFMMCVNFLSDDVGMPASAVADFVAGATHHILDDFIAFVAVEVAEKNAVEKARRN